jgi:3-phenylpropionate/trans-cinnamate dioxygenase ferredoxin reductase component
MQRQHVNFLLLGGGIAAHEAARAIRSRDTGSSILMVAREAARPYRRPELSKSYLLRKVPRESIFVDSARWHEQNQITLRTGISASQLDVNRHSVFLASGEEYVYDHLLIATGCAPKKLNVPGEALPNVHMLRNVNDADRLLHAIDTARHEGLPIPNDPDPKHRGRAVVIGGGLLGVEVAASLKTLGMHVELVVGRSHPWAHYAGQEVGRVVARSLESHGIVIHAERMVMKLEGDGRVQRVVLSDGTRIDTNLAIVCIGVDPTQELLRNTPIASEKAILVDQHCRTSAPDIFAAGDCAAAFDPMFNRYRYFPHWNQAAMLGAVAGDVMAGGDRIVDASIAIDSHWFELSGFICGERKHIDRRILRQTPDRIVEFGIAADGRLSQVVSVGDIDQRAARNLVARRVQTQGREEAFKDPNVELRSLI